MPLQIIEFYLILVAVRKVPNQVFWNLLATSAVMVLGGYLGEAGYIPVLLGFFIWLIGWIYILYELFAGTIGTLASKTSNRATSSAFGAMRMIVAIGWAIYPLCYVFGYLTGGLDSNTLNVIYNFADFINKIAFGLIVWVAARSQY